MNTLLWVVQSIVALVFIYSGVNKSLFSEKKLVASGQTGVESLPLGLIRFIGISEILGAFGLVLPGLLKILPILTPISAFCFSAIMIPAAVIHFKREEYKNVITNILLFFVCLFIAFYRIYLSNYIL